VLGVFKKSSSGGTKEGPQSTRNGTKESPFKSGEVPSIRIFKHKKGEERVYLREGNGRSMGSGSYSRGRKFGGGEKERLTLPGEGRSERTESHSSNRRGGGDHAVGIWGGKAARTMSEPG